MISVTIEMNDSWGNDGSIRISQLNADSAEYKVKNKGIWGANIKSHTTLVRMNDLMRVINNLVNYSTDTESDVMWMDGCSASMEIKGVGDADIRLTWQCEDKKRLTDEINNLAQCINNIKEIA